MQGNKVVLDICVIKKGKWALKRQPCALKEMNC